MYYNYLTFPVPFLWSSGGIYVRLYDNGMAFTASVITIRQMRWTHQTFFPSAYACKYRFFLHTAGAFVHFPIVSVHKRIQEKEKSWWARHQITFTESYQVKAKVFHRVIFLLVIRHHKNAGTNNKRIIFLQNFHMYF